MAKFAAEYTEEQIVQEALAQITWYHNIALMDKVSDVNKRLWYAKKIAENYWSCFRRYFDHYLIIIPAKTYEKLRKTHLA